VRDRSRGLFLYVEAGRNDVETLRRHQENFCAIADKEDKARKRGEQRRGKETFVVGGLDNDAGPARKLKSDAIVRYERWLTRIPDETKCGIIANPDLLTARPEKEKALEKLDK
jgi:hypothetical protein